MEFIVTSIIGILLIFMGYLIGIRKEINFIHSYHYKRVKKEDKDSFCKGVGVGNAIVGMGLIVFPLVNIYFGSTIATWAMGSLVALGLIIAITTIIKYNKGLF